MQHFYHQQYSCVWLRNLGLGHGWWGLWWGGRQVFHLRFCRCPQPILIQLHENSWGLQTNRALFGNSNRKDIFVFIFGSAIIEPPDQQLRAFHRFWLHASPTGGGQRSAHRPQHSQLLSPSCVPEGVESNTTRQLQCQLAYC